MTSQRTIINTFEVRKKTLEVKEEKLTQEKKHYEDLLETLNAHISLYDEAINYATPKDITVKVGSVGGLWSLGYKFGGKKMTLPEAKAEKEHLTAQRARLHLEINKLETALKYVRDEKNRVKNNLDLEEKEQEKLAVA